MDLFPSTDQLDRELKSFLEEATDKLCDWLASTSNSSPLPDARNFTEIAPRDKGLNRNELLRDLEFVMDGAYRPYHPGALAHLDPPAISSSIIADLISAGLNNNLLAYELSPSLSKLEKDLCCWMARKIGLSQNSGGVMASGGTISNLMALVIARGKADMSNDSKVSILASADAHVSLAKALTIMGLPKEALHKVPTNDRGEISIDCLQSEMKMIKKNGRKCFALVATAGTTIRGAIDNLDDLSNFCKERELWFHVDGAIGGVFALSESTRSLLSGISKADSISINPQKLLGVAKTSSLLLVKSREDLLKTFATQMPYLESMDGDNFNGGEICLQGTRPADVLKLWLGLRQLGQSGIQKLLDNSLRRRKYLYSLLNLDNFDIISGPLHLIALTPKHYDIEASEIWAMKTRENLLKNNFMLSKPTYQNRCYLKIVLGNPYTTDKHLDSLSRLLNNSIK